GLEHQAEQAKAAYEANPGPQTQAAMDRAVAALEASIRADQRPGPPVPSNPFSESEANDSAATADVLPPLDYGDGDLSPTGDIDFWTNGYSAGVDDLAFAYVDTSGSSSGTDSQLNVYANDGTTLIEFDDDAGPGLTSCVAGAVVPQAGNVYYRINEYEDNNEITPYLLCAGIAGATAAETESNDTAGTADALSWATPVMTGTLPGGDTDYFSFQADAGDVLAVIVDDDPDDDANQLDTDITIVDTDGVSVLATGDNQGSHDGNCAGGATTLAPTTGTYYVVIDAGSGGGGDVDYRFVVCVHGQVPVELQS
ncbi:MAG: hypothetical protein GY838_14815, partial [bacterium]|nr:hypothetical protein [bacterium]